MVIDYSQQVNLSFYDLLWNVYAPTLRSATVWDWWWEDEEDAAA